MENTQTRTFRLSGRWMEDHLDSCQGEDYWGPAGDPVGKYVGAQWVGELNGRQVAEVVSRAEYYADFDGYDYRENRSIVDAARRTLAAIKKQKVAR